MNTRHIVTVVIGFIFFLTFAVLNSVMAPALGFAHPLMVLWILVPLPIVFLFLHLKVPQDRWVKIISYSYLWLGGILTVALWSGGWYFSDIFKESALLPDHTSKERNLEVTDIGKGKIILRTTELTKEDSRWAMEGIWGLESDSGYSQVGTILGISDTRVSRELLSISGYPKSGEAAKLDDWAFTGNPTQAFGLPFQEVSFSSTLGEFSAWLIDGTGTTWVIFIHGKGSGRGQALRVVPTIAELGLPFLVITYRNDPGMPEDKNGFYKYGQGEHEDLQGAVKYALDHGAKELILVGYSMGGAIVSNFLHESVLANKIIAVILDAPMLNFNSTVSLGARQRGYPQFILPIGKAVSSFRFGIDWETLDYIKYADDLSTPILLFHSDADKIVPIETSDKLAEIRPDLVKYVRLTRTPHGSSWNIDPKGYNKFVHDFLTQMTK